MTQSALLKRKYIGLPDTDNCRWCGGQFTKKRPSSQHCTIECSNNTARKAYNERYPDRVRQSKSEYKKRVKTA